MNLGIALQYLPDSMDIPKIVASGQGRLADEIVRMAEASGVEVVHDQELAMDLSELPVGSEIPENLYRAIAAVFAFLMEERRR